MKSHPKKILSLKTQFPTLKAIFLIEYFFLPYFSYFFSSTAQA